MTFDWNEWLHIVTRWVHVFAGILWIGQTYFFTWLDGRFHELAEVSKEKKGDPNVWMVHSGGFYVVEKQSVPRMFSSKLHWFKWEAAMTWLSGMILLILVYYTGGMLIDAAVDETAAIGIGLGFLVAGWVVYDVLWNSPLGKTEWLAVGISFLVSMAAIYGLSQVFGGRTAYIHAGALFGTIMTANVWMRILPAQRKMVGALQRGEQVDPSLAERAKQRSRHNTFLIVPVVFIMISNHYPTSSYAAEYNWLILSVLVALGWGAAYFLRRA